METETKPQRAGTQEMGDPSLNIPNDPDEALAMWLTHFRIVREGEGKSALEETRDFLSQGERVALPQIVDTPAGKSPYRLYPISSYKVINACVKVLEKQLEEELMGNKPSPEREKELVGIMTLAEQMFSGACCHPEGRFSIHTIDTQTRKVVLNPHGRRVRQLAYRLEKYREARLALARRNQTPLELPPLSAVATMEQEVKNSFQIWKMVDTEEWTGQRPEDLADSLDSLKENKGWEAQEQKAPILDFEEAGTIEEEEIAQSAFLGLPLDGNLRFETTRRGNLLATSPKAWLWDYEEDPLSFVVDYVSGHAKPCLEEAHTLLMHALDRPGYEEAGMQARVLNPASKVNPDSYWQIIRRAIQNYPSAKMPESEAMIRKLDCARFTLCLDMTNRNLGIDPEEFQRSFYAKVREVLQNPERREAVTRNEILLETIREDASAKAKGWGTVEAEIWLEHLQSSAVGGYEKSVGMENARKTLLAKLNHLFKQARELIEEASKNPTNDPENIGKIRETLRVTAGAFYKYLSGKTGQMTRRELRTKIYSLKTAAERKGDKDQAERFTKLGKFITSISSQIKSKEWYEKKEEIQNTLLDFLVEMLQTPRTSTLEFPGSKEPEPKEALEMSVDFLKAYASENLHPTGKHTIDSLLELCRERTAETAGGKLNEALKKISKNWVEEVAVIENRQTSLAGALAIARGAAEERDVVTNLCTKMAEEVEILNTEKGREAEGRTSLEEIGTAQKELMETGSPEALQKAEEVIGRAANHLGDQDADEVFKASQELQRACQNRYKQCLEFWKGLHYIGQNIASRNEPEHFQISRTGRGTLQNLIAMAKAKTEDRPVAERKGPQSGTMRQFGMTRTRERTLWTNIAVPVALWLEAEVKGTKTKITQAEFIKTLEERHQACVLCLEISHNDHSITKTLEEFQSQSRADRISINVAVLERCIEMLEDPENLTKGLRWQSQNKTKAAQMTEAEPELDTPVKKAKALETEGAQKKTKKTKNAEVEIA